MIYLIEMVILYHRVHEKGLPFFYHCHMQLQYVEFLSTPPPKKIILCVKNNI